MNGRPHSQNKIFGIHGGGNIGLGLMAQIVSQSAFHYDIVATSNNFLICHLINSTNKFGLQHDPHHYDNATEVSHVTMVPRDTQHVIRLYKEASIVALCVTSAVVPHLAHDIAKGLITRFQTKATRLPILILMNMPDCATFVKNKVYEALLKITGNKSEANKIISSTDFIPTVIDRIVTSIPEKNIKRQLKNQLEKIDKKDLLKHLGDDNIHHILSSPQKTQKAIAHFHLTCNLFYAEKNFSMHVPHTFTEAYQFPLMHIANDLRIIEAVKNKFINGPHAILAWAGTLLGFGTIAESIQHPGLFAFIKDMMEQEIRPILCAEYPDLSEEELEHFEKTFFERCRASVNDLNSRVGRDPLRKLNRGERVRGPLELAKKHDLKISTRRLEQGLAAGLLYAVKFDQTNPGCQKIKEIYEMNNHSFRAVLCHNSQTFTGFTPNKDDALIKNILHHIKYFNENHTRVKPSSSTALIKTTQSIVLTLPKPLSMKPTVLTKEHDAEKQAAQMMAQPNYPVTLHPSRHQHWIWHSTHKKSASILGPILPKRLGNGRF